MDYRDKAFKEKLKSASLHFGAELKSLSFISKIDECVKDACVTL